MGDTSLNHENNWLIYRNPTFYTIYRYIGPFGSPQGLCRRPRGLECTDPDCTVAAGGGVLGHAHPPYRVLQGSENRLPFKVTVVL